MPVKAQRVSKKMDNVTWCRPSEGYDTDNAIEVELGDYMEVCTVPGELPENDRTWPQGAPMTGYVKVGDKIYMEEQLVVQNVFDMNPDTPIYRILPIKHLIQDVADGKVTIGRVIAWEDTHEAAFYRRNVVLPRTNQLVGLDLLARDWFGQCWMTVKESDAMWRIYNADGLSVRISTTPRILISQVFKGRCRLTPSYSDLAWISIYLGKVKYYPEDKFRKEMEMGVSNTFDSSGKAIARQMLKKRDPFDHEREVRFLYHAHTKQGGLSQPPGDIELLSAENLSDFQIGCSVVRLPRFIRLPFDWKCITEAMIGPRAPQDAARYIQTVLRVFTPWILVSQSTLYGKPNYKAFFDGDHL